MINKEWLKKMKEIDENIFKQDFTFKKINIPDDIKFQWRQAKALEIIAEELIELNENMDRYYVLKRGTIDQDGHLVNERE